ncbi:hypothetical protein DFS34DRAFT_598445 [Phlyctochytrium arcticum]|nr:hypothetical protein DFS34DRAFT_598445 [Phlyctochytrium arcticum]
MSIAPSSHHHTSGLYADYGSNVLGAAAVSQVNGGFVAPTLTAPCSIPVNTTFAGTPVNWTAADCIDPYALYINDTSAPSTLAFYDSITSIPATRSQYPTITLGAWTIKEYFAAMLAMVCPFPIVQTGFYVNTKYTEGAAHFLILALKHLCLTTVEGVQNLNVVVTGMFATAPPPVGVAAVLCPGLSLGDAATQNYASNTPLLVNTSSATAATAVGYSLREIVYSWWAPTTAAGNFNSHNYIVVMRIFTEYIVPRFDLKDTPAQVDPLGLIRNKGAQWISTSTLATLWSERMRAANGMTADTSQLEWNVFLIPALDYHVLSDTVPFDALGMVMTTAARELMAANQLAHLNLGISAGDLQSASRGTSSQSYYWRLYFTYDTQKYTSEWAGYKQRVLANAVGYSLPKDSMSRDIFDGIWIKAIAEGIALDTTVQYAQLPSCHLTVGQLCSVLNVRLAELLLPTPGENLQLTLSSEAPPRFVEVDIAGVLHLTMVTDGFSGNRGALGSKTFWKLMNYFNWTDDVAGVANAPPPYMSPFSQKRAVTSKSSCGRIFADDGVTSVVQASLGTPLLERKILEGQTIKAMQYFIPKGFANQVLMLQRGGLFSTMGWAYTPTAKNVLCAISPIANDADWISILPTFSDSVEAPDISAAKAIDTQTIDLKSSGSPAAGDGQQ